MKVKLLKKVRKEYKVFYSKEPFRCVLVGDEFIFYHYKLTSPNIEIVLRSLEDCISGIIWDLRIKYKKLGSYNRRNTVIKQIQI